MILLATILYIGITPVSADNSGKDTINADNNYSITANTQFDSPELKKIKQLNDKLFTSIMKNTPSIMYDMSIEPAKAHGKKVFEDFYKNYGKVIRENEITLIKNYGVNVKEPTSEKSFTIPRKYTIGYEIKFPAMFAENIFSIYTFTHENNQYHITIVYVKTDDAWKLYAFRIGAYSLLNQTAIDLYKRAQLLEQKGHTIMALLWLSNIKSYLKPSPFAYYPQEKDILEYQQKLTDKIDQKHDFPIEITSIESKPKLYTVSGVFVQEDLVPVIKYRSTLYDKSEAVLKVEADAITKKIENIFPGITVYQNNLLFQIFPPEGEDSDNKKSKAVYTEIK